MTNIFKNTICTMLVLSPLVALAKEVPKLSADNQIIDAVIEYKKPTNLIISSTGVNRISVHPNIIKSIWGNGSEYTASLSDSGSELFITSKLEAGNSISLSMKLVDGKVIDLAMNVLENKLPKIINLKSKQLETKEFVLRHEASEMLKAMRLKVQGKYYVQDIKHNYKITNFPNLELNQKRIYQFRDLRGLVLTVKNTGTKSVSIDAIDFAKNIKDIIAVRADNMLLTKGQESNVFLILEKKEV